MQHKRDGVHVAGAEDRLRDVRLRGAYYRASAKAGAAALVALALVFGVREAVGARERRVLREELAQAAALDRRSREDQIRVWTTALNTDPASALALAQLAGLNVQKARESGSESYYPVAESMARRSLELRTQRNTKTYVVLASALLAQHRFAEARDAALAALALEPEVPQYRALAAEINMEMGDYDAAARGFSGLMPYRTHLSIGPRLARWKEVTGQHMAAREILQQLVTQAEERRDLPREQLAWFHFRLGDHFRRHGSFRRARTSFTRALDVNPGDYRALKALAELELLLGNGRRAVKHARAAVAVSRTPETLLTLATALRESGNTTEAVAIEGEVARILGDGGSFERAWHTYRMEWDVAAPDLTALLEREARVRSDVQGYDLLAWSYYKSNRLADAAGAISSALRTGTSDATVWYHAGVIAYESGDRAAARPRLQKALELNPSFHPQQSAQARAILKSMGG